MTTPNIRTDHAVVTDAAAELRGIADSITAAADAVTTTTAAASAKPLTAGTAEGPEVAVLAAVMTALGTSLHTADGDVTAAAAGLSAWEGTIGNIDSGGAGGVAAVGSGGGSW
jgi:hypothetical protein